MNTQLLSPVSGNQGLPLIKVTSHSRGILIISRKYVFQVHDANHCSLDQVIFNSKVKDGLLMCSYSVLS